jgi:hypothetical protein
MPWIVPSHQALILPLKLWKPQVFSGLGLVLGTMAPDLAFILRLDTDAIAAHTFAGQLSVTLPLALALHWIGTSIVFPWLMPHLPAGGPFYLNHVTRSRPARSPLEWARVAFSALVGGLTHVGLDGFTHGNHVGWACHYLPTLAQPVLPLGHPVPLYRVLQVSLTILLGVPSVTLWHRLARRSPAGPDAARPSAAPPPECGWLLGALIALAAAGAAVAVGLHTEAPVARRAELAVYGALALPIFGLVLGGLLDRARRLLAAPAGAGHLVREDL